MPAEKDYPWGESRMAMVSKFMTGRQCAEKYNVPYGTIAARSARDEWFKKPPEEVIPVPPKRNKETGEITPHVAAPPLTQEQSIAIVQETAHTMKEELRTLGAKAARKGLRHLASDKVDDAAVVDASKNLKDLVDVAAKASGFDTPDNLTVLSMSFLSDEQGPTVIEA